MPPRSRPRVLRNRYDPNCRLMEAIHTTPLNALSDARSAYVHVPFCRHRCGYCNFTLIANRDELQDAYLDALELELRQLQRPHPVETLFVGGGTPTHLRPAQRERFLGLLENWLPLEDGGEYSVESNPGDINPPLLASLQAAGVNRLSLGVQSFDPQTLRTLERDHSPATALRAVEAARSHFPQVSIDLIFGAPGQRLASWIRDLDQATQSGATHLSTYGLTYEKGSAFWGRVRRDQLAPVSEELERKMYLEAIQRLTASDPGVGDAPLRKRQADVPLSENSSGGFEHYEVSNFARPGCRCRHNIGYWRGGDYLAFGPGASRHYQGRRETNHRSVTTYIRRMLAGLQVVGECEELTAEQQASERLVFGLRMREGVDREWFAAETGCQLEHIAGERLAAHVAQGLIGDDGQRVWLTEAGLLVSDGLLVDFVR